MPWRMRLRDFLGPKLPVSGNPYAWSIMGNAPAAMLHGAIRGTPFPARFNPALTVHPVGIPGEFVVTDALGAPIGMRVGDTVVADPNFKNQGVGLSLVDAWWNETPWTAGTVHDFTDDGHGLLTAYHRRMVTLAIAEGRDVPQAVRDDHSL